MMTPCDHNRLPCQGFIWKCQTERISRPGWMRQGTEPSSQTRRIHVMCWNQAANDLICKFASIIVLFTGVCSHGAPFRTSQQFFAFAVPTWTFWVSLKCATKCTPYTALHITTHPCTQHNRTSPFCGLENLSHSPSYTILHHAAAPAGTGAMIVETAHAEVQPGATQTGVDSTISTCFWMSSWGFMGFMGHWNFNKFHMS